MADRLRCHRMTAGRGGDAHCRRKHRRSAVKGAGLLDWSRMTQKPFVDVTKNMLTLYASDRHVFLFLVDDVHPRPAPAAAGADSSDSAAWRQAALAAATGKMRTRTLLACSNSLSCNLFYSAH